VIKVLFWIGLITAIREWYLREEERRPDHTSGEVVFRRCPCADRSREAHRGCGRRCAPDSHGSVPVVNRGGRERLGDLAAGSADCRAWFAKDVILSFATVAVDQLGGGSPR
jgi:hypothetical protein